VEAAQLCKAGFVGGPGLDRQSAVAAEGDCILGEFEALDLVVLPRLLQEEPIGAADFQEPPRGPISANERDRARKFAPQHRLRAAVIGVAVRMNAREIVAGVVPLRVEVRRLGASQSAGRTPQDHACVLDEQLAVLGGFGTRRTGQEHLQTGETAHAVLRYARGSALYCTSGPQQVREGKCSGRAPFEESGRCYSGRSLVVPDVRESAR